MKLGASGRLPIGAQKCYSSVPDSTAAAPLDINTALLAIYWEIISTKRRGLRSYESLSTLSGPKDRGEKKEASSVRLQGGILRESKDTRNLFGPVLGLIEGRPTK